jgi:hypothetical protein
LCPQRTAGRYTRKQKSQAHPRSLIAHNRSSSPPKKKNTRMPGTIPRLTVSHTNTRSFNHPYLTQPPVTAISRFRFSLVYYNARVSQPGCQRYSGVSCMHIPYPRLNAGAYTCIVCSRIAYKCDVHKQSRCADSGVTVSLSGVASPWAVVVLGHWPFLASSPDCWCCRIIDP